MKGLILAAGRGTRLKPLTETRSKPMVPLANRPLIAWTLDKLAAVDITDVGIVVGDNESELRGGLSYPGLSLSYIRQPEPKGLAHAVSFAREFTGDDDFVLLFCDNLFSADLHESMQEWRHLRSNEASLVGCMIHTYEVEDPRACGVAVVEDGWAVELEEKPQQPRSNRAIVGIDFFTPAIYDAIGRIRPSARGELEITDAISQLLADGLRVRARELQGFWYDTGTFSDLITAHRHVLSGLASLESHGTVGGAAAVNGELGLGQGSQLDGGSVTGPVLVGGNSSVRDCRLGPNVSIGNDCRLQDCSLQDCLVLDGARLNGEIARACIFVDGERIDAG